MKKIDITEDEIEALRVCKEWGVVDGSWAHNHLVELYNRIVEQLANPENKGKQKIKIK